MVYLLQAATILLMCYTLIGIPAQNRAKRGYGLTMSSYQTYAPRTFSMAWTAMTGARICCSIVGLVQAHGLEMI